MEYVLLIVTHLVQVAPSKTDMRLMPADTDQHLGWAQSGCRDPRELVLYGICLIKRAARLEGGGEEEKYQRRTKRAETRLLAV